MANGIRTSDPPGFNKGRSSKFRVGSRVWQTPEEGRRTYRPKRYRNNNRDEDNSPKTLNDNNIKNMLISESWLTHFNPDSEKLVAADASDYGIVEVMS